MRTWTEQGRLPCLRINSRGDRRYRIADLEAFLEQATRRARPTRLAIPDLRPWTGPPTPPRATAGPEVAPGAITEHILASGAREPDRRDIELRVLTGIARSIATASDLDVALAVIARLLRESFGYRVVSFAELTGDLLWLRAADGLDVSRIPPIGREHGLSGASLTERRPIFAPDVDRDPRYVVNLPEVRAEIAVPIFIEGEPWGVLLVGDDRVGALSTEDAEGLAAAGEGCHGDGVEPFLEDQAAGVVVELVVRPVVTREGAVAVHGPHRQAQLVGPAHGGQEALGQAA